MDCFSIELTLSSNDHELLVLVLLALSLIHCTSAYIIRLHKADSVFLVIDALVRLSHSTWLR